MTVGWSPIVRTFRSETIAISVRSEERRVGKRRNVVLLPEAIEDHNLLGRENAVEECNGPHDAPPAQLPGSRRSDQKLFFFSSRRRHTILTCDWSSDVCSSDLGR